MVSHAARVGAMTTTRPSGGRPGYRSLGGVLGTSTMRLRFCVGVASDPLSGGSKPPAAINLRGGRKGRKQAKG
jgi:hypothetical protein